MDAEEIKHVETLINIFTKKEVVCKTGEVSTARGIMPSSLTVKTAIAAGISIV